MKSRFPGAPMMVVALLWATGCRPAPPDWIPVLEETSTSFLQTAVARNRERIAEARARPAEAEELLAAAERDLRSLEEIYLPLLEARNRAYNAYRFHHLGRNGDAEAEIDAIEATVLRLGEGAQGSLLAELKSLEERVADARVEIGAGSEGVETALQRLADALANFVAKADLFL